MRILCFSGGPDCLCAIPLFEPDLLFHCNLGMPSSVSEETAVLHLVRLLDLPLARFINRLVAFAKPNSEIPYRNLFLVANAALHGEGPLTIGLAVEKGTTANDSHDRDPYFFGLASTMLSHLSGESITVEPILQDYTKFQAVAKFLQFQARTGVDPKVLLRASTSCYARRSIGSLQCGNCPACIRRFIAFYLNGIEEDYQENPAKSSIFSEYLDRAMKGAIDKTRGEEIMVVADKLGFRLKG
jgi:Queuosine biosynthesis protein QueC